ncbi:MAG: hypothetical protein P8046_10275, partial [Anaerolineales bacterium]
APAQRGASFVSRLCPIVIAAQPLGLDLDLLLPDSMPFETPRYKQDKVSPIILYVEILYCPRY